MDGGWDGSIDVWADIWRIVKSIVFIRDRNNKGQEVSGYIDYAERLKTEDWTQYFSGKKRLLPRASDLSYYNWDTQAATATSTTNFQVLSDSAGGKHCRLSG